MRLAKRTAMRAMRAGCLPWRGTASSISASTGRLSICARRRPLLPSSVLPSIARSCMARTSSSWPLRWARLEQLVDVGLAVADGDEPAVRAVPGGLLDGGQRLAAT